MITGGNVRQSRLGFGKNQILKGHSLVVFLNDKGVMVQGEIVNVL